MLGFLIFRVGVVTGHKQASYIMTQNHDFDMCTAPDHISFQARAARAVWFTPSRDEMVAIVSQFLVNFA